MPELLLDLLEDRLQIGRLALVTAENLPHDLIVVAVLSAASRGLLGFRLSCVFDDC
jgi:hypothetical protein